MTLPPRLLPRLLPLLLPIVLAGCESLSPAECATADWRQLGMHDGARGQLDRIADYHASCSKVGIKVDAAGYRAGRDQGLQAYCRLDNAINEGLAGRSYNGVCLAPFDANFRMFHEAGYREQDARKTLARLQREQDKQQSDLRNAKTDEQKRALREQLARSDRRMDEAREALRSAELRLDRLRSDLRRQGPY
jgi:hypothetical protein